MDVNKRDVDIKQIRKELNLTQQEFADKLGITREIVGQMERGDKGISKATKILIENFLKENKVPSQGLKVEQNKDENVSL